MNAPARAGEMSRSLQRISDARGAASDERFGKMLKV
jgi:hypothetical protein